jgi:ParB family chromosome partitioning protein
MLDEETAIIEQTFRGADGAMREVPVTDIESNPYQPRRVFHEAALQELVASIEEHGVLQPVIVRPHGDRFQLVSGERRTMAARRAGLSTIPAIIQHYDDRRMLEIAIVENVQREDISPLEAAEAYKRLMEEFSLTQEQVAARVGKSRPAVANTLRLLNLPSPIRESLSRGEITEGHARSLLSIPDPEWRERVWRKIIAENLTVRAAEGLASPSPPAQTGEAGTFTPPVSRETSRKERAARRDPDLVAVEGRLRLLLGTRVRIKGTQKSGSIVVDYFSEEDLHRLAGLLGLT